MDHRLSDWPECRLELNCCGQIVMPTKYLANHYGNRTFADVLTRLRCGKCGGAPAPVYLCAGVRSFSLGPPADWAIELVAPERPSKR